jgi:hypothetical protein
VDANGIDLAPLVRDALREDLIHHESVEVLLHGLMNHHVPEDLHDDVVSLGQMVYVEHLLMDDARQNELDAPLALNFARDVKDGMGVALYSPSLLSPSRSLIMVLILLLILGK